MYGKTPEQLENITKMFITVLAPYPLEEISKAFVEWVRTESKMPTPADILGIIKWEPLPQSHAPEHKLLLAHENKEKPTQQQIDQLKEYMTVIEKNLKSEKKVERGTVDYSHWNGMPDEVKEHMRQEFIKSREKLIGAQ